MKSKKNQGITLIALEVTIIVMLILAGATMSMLTGNSGILTNAKKAKENARGSDVQEEINLVLSENGMADYVGGNKKTRAEVINKLKEENKITEEEVALLEEQNIITIGDITIDFSVFGAIAGRGIEADVETNYVGYYADIDGDGDVDGIIYADLLHGETGEYGKYSDTYTIPTLSANEVKKYMVSSENYTDPELGEKEIIIAKEGSTGEDRFYVMSLRDLEMEPYGCFDWYSAVDYSNNKGMTDYETYTSTDFGKGKENTRKMIEKWNNEGYGEKNAPSDINQDIWGVIQEDVKKGWFVPSKDEWSAFASKYGNVSREGWDTMFGKYWTSSQCDPKYVWVIWPKYGEMFWYHTSSHMENDGFTSARLSATF